MSAITYPLDVAVLEAVPHNKRKTEVVRLARKLAPEEQKALAMSLCMPKGASVNTRPAATEKLRTDDLSRFIESGAATSDPTTSYHLQELGLLVATSSDQKQHLLTLAETKNNKLIASKALRLAINSRCVGDEDIQGLFDRASERVKREIVRACARTAIRQSLTDEMVRRWLKDTHERRLLACEILHLVSDQTSWFITELRNIFFRKRVATLNKGSQGESAQRYAHEEAYFAALRLEMMWKFHDEEIYAEIAAELRNSRNIIDNAAVFDFWAPLFDPSSWKFPGKKTAHASSVAEAASYVRYEDLLNLYVAHLPFEPTNSNVKALWMSQRFEGVVQDPGSAFILDSLKTLKAYTASWAPHMKLVIPSWVQSQHLHRHVLDEDVFTKIAKNLSDSQGIFKKETLQLTKVLLGSLIRYLNYRPSTAFTNAVVLHTKKVLALTTPAVFYTGLLSEDDYASPEEYEQAKALVTTYKETLEFVRSLLQHGKTSVGQQIELFLVLSDFGKTLAFRSEDLRSPLQLVPVDRIKKLMKDYSGFLHPYATIVLGSIAPKLARATERGLPVDSLNSLFARVVKLGYTDVQNDVEKMYSILAKPYPKVFATLPEQWYVTFLAHSLKRQSSLRLFKDADVASRQLNDLFLKVIMPSIRRNTWGEEALFTDRPDHQYAIYKGTSHLPTRVQAIESMEAVRWQWFLQICDVFNDMLGNAQLSDEATNAYLDFLDEWLKLATDTALKALEASRANSHATGAKSEHPDTAQRSELSISGIGLRVSAFIDYRCGLFSREEWRDKEQSANVAIIQRAFRLWSAATFYKDSLDPFKKGGPTRLVPVAHEPLMRAAYKLPDVARRPFDSVLHTLFALRLNGKVRTADGAIVDSQKSKPREANSWQECASLFTSIFSSGKLTGAAHEVLMHLENLPKEERASTAFLKELERFMDVTKPSIRKRLENDLTKPAFSDRLKCVEVLMQATSLTRSSAEICKTLSRLAKLIENENRENRRQALGLVHSTMKTTMEIALPKPDGAGDRNNRVFVAYLHSAPQETEWPAILSAATDIPKVLFKLMDDMLDSTDEKAPGDFRDWRSIADEIIRSALTWPCSLIPTGDARIQDVQRAWFESAFEIHWRLTVFLSGKAQAPGTFRPTLSSTTITRVRNMIMEAGYQPDRPFPHGKEETRAYEAEAALRRREKAIFITKLFEDAYASRIGEPPPLGTPLGRKLAIEKKRILDLLNLVQGEWTVCPSVNARLEDVVTQISQPDTTDNHQKQVLELMKTCTEASLSWGVRVRDSRPAWAVNIRGGGIESIERERKRGGATDAGKKSKRGAARKHGRGGKLTRKVDLNEEDAPWIATKYFRFLPPLIPRYWELAIRRFGIHHPGGQSTGRCILRMLLRWYFARADACSTRAERQKMRCEVALMLLDICPSAVHIQVVQAALKDFRQDLLEQYVFSREKTDPILGKFSYLSPNEADDEYEEDDSEGSDGGEIKVVRPFRLYGFYGFDKLTSRQGRQFAEFLTADVENSELSVVERVAAASKLAFLPAVGHMDMAAILTTHFDNRIKYAEAIRKKKAEGVEVTATPPLPPGVVETLFKAVLLDTNPEALFSLLSPAMMRESSTKTTILVAQRLALMLRPIDVTEVIRVLLSRKGRDGLLVGPVKALLRILYNFSFQSEGVVGADVISGAVATLEAQWIKTELHTDARAVLIVSALKTLTRPTNDQNDAFAWRVLEDVANSLEMSDQLRALLLSAEPETATIAALAATTGSGFTADFERIAKEASRQGTVLVRDKARFLQLLLSAIRATEKRIEVAERKVEEVEDDKRKRGAARKQASLAADLRALLILNLGRWVDTSLGTYEQVVKLLSSVVLSLDNTKRTNENQSRQLVYKQFVPTSLAQLVSVSVTKGKAHVAYQDSKAAERIESVLRVLIDGLLGAVPLTQPYKRSNYASALSAIANNLSKENGKKSLHRRAFVQPFKTELAYLKSEAETIATVSSYVPAAAAAALDPEQDDD